jgi:hypothetical protein
MYGVSGFGTVVLVMAWAGAVVLRTMPTHRDETAMYGAPDTRFWRQLRLVCAGGRFAGCYFFEEPDDAYAEEAEER